MTAAITVLGAGSWGTALAAHLCRSGHATTLWGRDVEDLDDIRLRQRNSRYLGDVALPAELRTATDLTQALGQAEHVLVATPCASFRAILKSVIQARPDNPGLIWACKGLEPETGKLLDQVAREELGEQARFAVISGPTFAGEVARGLPAALTVAGSSDAYAFEVAALLHHGSFRAYTSDDLIGVQIGGALKNVLAIAAGISDGLGFGANSRAALITRGLSELARLGRALGGQRKTFMGLAGMGDLVLTCTDNQSRNRRFGLLLAEGLTVEAARQRIGQAVEGIRTTLEAHRLALRLQVETPIIDQVYAVVYGEASAREAVEALSRREPKAEWDD